MAAITTFSIRLINGWFGPTENINIDPYQGCDCDDLGYDYRSDGGLRSEIGFKARNRDPGSLPAQHTASQLEAFLHVNIVNLRYELK